MHPQKPAANAQGAKRKAAGGMWSCALHIVHALVTRGRQKKSTGSPVHLLNTSRLFFLAFSVLVRVWAFLGKGSSKTPLKYFCKKSMPKIFSKTFGVSFSSICFGFIAFLGVLQRWEFKNTIKTCQKSEKKT
jgi:hypothetical protein